MDTYDLSTRDGMHRFMADLNTCDDAKGKLFALLAAIPPLNAPWSRQDYLNALENAGVRFIDDDHSC